MRSSPMLTGTEAAQPKLDILSEVGLTAFEGARVRELVGREPNALEWAMFGAMWSEHCAYKHSKKLLRTLPTKGARVALGPGENPARPGSAVYRVGSDTGRDGIAGASLLASFELGTGSDAKRPSVQVGNPFLEKLLMEATLELVELDTVEAVQDLGAAGLTCASSEVAARSGVGMRIDVDRVPRRAKNMSPYEVMLSESQERMLVIARPGREGH